MSGQVILQAAIRNYEAGLFDKAIESLVQLEETPTKKSTSEVARLKMWLGKCYFNKTETFTYAYHVHYSIIKGNDFGQHPGPTQYGQTSRKMTQEALIYFREALELDPSLHEAHYLKGRALEYENKIDNAYDSFIQAATLSFSEKYLRKISTLFSQHRTLPFKKIRSFESMDLDKILELCSSREAYLRAEACHYLLDVVFKNTEKADQIIKSITPLAGHRVFCFYIPITGDADERVRLEARALLWHQGKKG